MVDIFEDYYEVRKSKIKVEIIKRLSVPWTPSGLSEWLHVPRETISRNLNEMEKMGLIESHDLPPGKKTYRLTTKGDLHRNLLDSLVVPKDKITLVHLLKVRSKVIGAILKNMIKDGLIMLFRTSQLSRKYYTLTRRGEIIREKLE